MLTINIGARAMRGSPPNKLINERFRAKSRRIGLKEITRISEADLGLLQHPRWSAL